MRLVNRFVVALAVLTTLLFAAAPFASAQQTSGGSGLSISPTISQFTLNVGQSASINITLKNVTQGTVTAQGIVNDFTSDGVSGNPVLLTQPGASSPNSIKKFIFGLSNITLEKGQQKLFSVGVQIPKGTAPGAYYGVLRYKAVPAGSNAPAPGQVALTASVGTIVLVTVPGNVHEQVQLKAIHIYHGTRDSSFFLTKPNKIGVEVDNLGNGFEKPFGTVEVQNTFGKEVTSYPFNNPKQLGNVLPNSTRIFGNPVSKITQPGRYTVLVSMSYGDGSNVLSLKKTFWYIPFWLAAIIAAILIFLIVLTFRLYFRYRRDARHSFRR